MPNSESYNSMKNIQNSYLPLEFNQKIQYRNQTGDQNIREHDEDEFDKHDDQ